MEIMEPATSLESRGSVVLQYPERWGEAIKIRSFLAATATCSLPELRSVCMIGRLSQYHADTYAVPVSLHLRSKCLLNTSRVNGTGGGEDRLEDFYSLGAMKSN